MTAADHVWLQADGLSDAEPIALTGTARDATSYPIVANALNFGHRPVMPGPRTA